MSTKKIVAVVAGASGGHLIPGITSALAALNDESAQEVLFFTTCSLLDQSILKNYATTFSISSLPILPLPGKKWWCYPRFFLSMIKSFFISFRILRSKRPYQLISMGGLVSIPVCLAARLLGIKIILFELNAIPGKAVTFLAPLAHKIWVCFDDAGTYFKSEKVQIHSYPLRFTEKDRLQQDEARKNLGLEPQKKTLLIVGGSQGSQTINTIIETLISEYPQVLREIQIIHQTGAYKIGTEFAHHWFADFFQRKDSTAVVFDFTDDLHICYSAADVVIARAGAGTLFELQYFLKKTLIIPLENVAQSHQVDNALAMIRQNPELFFLLRQRHLQKMPSLLYDQLTKMLNLSGN